MTFDVQTVFDLRFLSSIRKFKNKISYLFPLNKILYLVFSVFHLFIIFWDNKIICVYFLPNQMLKTLRNGGYFISETVADFEYTDNTKRIGFCIV